MLTRFILTTVGQEYLAAAINEKTLNFTKAAFGSGAPADAPSQVTALANQLGTMPISSKKTNGNVTTISTEFSNYQNKAILPAFKMSEVALWGKVMNGNVQDPNYPEALIAYGSADAAQAEYIPAELTEFLMNFSIRNSNAANIDIIVDGSLTYATKAEVNAVQESVNGLESAIAGKQDAATLESAVKAFINKAYVTSLIDDGSGVAY